MPPVPWDADLSGRWPGTRWLDLAGAGVLDLSVLEPHVFPLEKINEALDEGLPARHGGFTNVIAAPEHATAS